MKNPRPPYQNGPHHFKDMEQNRFLPLQTRRLLLRAVGSWVFHLSLPTLLETGLEGLATPPRAGGEGDYSKKSKINLMEGT